MAESKIVYDEPTVLNDKDLKFFYVIKHNVTIAAGTTSSAVSTSVDVSSDIPAGYSVAGIVDAYLNNARMPYRTPSAFTLIDTVTTGGSISFKSTSSAWTNYTLYALLLIRKQQ